MPPTQSVHRQSFSRLTCFDSAGRKSKDVQSTLSHSTALCARLTKSDVVCDQVIETIGGSRVRAH